MASESDPGDYNPNNPTWGWQCPCCDYFTLAELKDDDICPLCFWEYDGLNVDRPDESSRANAGLTLRQARKNFETIGACEEAMLGNVLTPEERKRFPRRQRPLGPGRS